MAWSLASRGRRPLLATAILIVIGLVLLVTVCATTTTGQGIVAQLVSRALSTEARKVSIGRIEGLFSSALTIGDIAIADRAGTWLKLDRVHVLWMPVALLRLEVSIETLDVDHMEILRKPVADAESASDQEPLRLPQLPVAVEVARFALASLVVDRDLFGTPALLAAKGSARLGPAQGVALVLDIARRDRPGGLVARVDFVPESEALRASLHLDEPAGGILAEIADLPERPPVALSVDGDGTLDVFRAKLGFHAGPRIDADGTLALLREGPALNLVLDLAARLPTFAFGRMQGKVSAVARDEAPGTFDLSGEAAVTGLKLADLAFTEAIGTDVRLTMRGSGKPTGPIDIESSRLASPSLSIDFQGRLAPDDSRGHLAAAVPDLSRFAALAALALKGEATFAADVSGVPSQSRFAATIDAAARRFATGNARIDRLIGGASRLEGDLRYDPDTGFTADNLTLSGSNAHARIAGTAGPEATAVTALLSIPSLEKADERLAGRGEATVRLTGTLARPDAILEARISDGALLGRAVPSLALEARGSDLRGAFQAQARLDGTIGGKVARGSLHAARSASGEIRVAPLELAIGSVEVTGAGTVDPASLVSGKLAVHARDLDDLSPLVLDKLSGSLDADVTFTREGGRQDAVMAANGQRIAGFGVGLEQISADLTATDLTRHPVLSGSAEVRDARIGGETVERLRLDAKGAPDASDVIVTATARGVDLESRGRVVAAEPIRLELTQFDVARGRTRIGLAGPATLTIEDGGATIRALVLAMNGGRLALDGRAGPRSDLKLVARAVPLAVAELVAPDLGLAGTLDGEAAIAGALGSPTGTYHLRLAKVESAQTKAAGLPPIGAEAQGRLEGARAALDASVVAGEAGRLTITGSAPLAAGGSLDLALKGNFDIAAAGRAWAVEGRRVTGAVALDGRVTGTLQRPSASGSAILSNGSFQDAVQGTRLDAIRARLVARDDKITIESASATARNGGVVTVSGEVRLDPGGGFPGTLEVRGQRAEVVRSSIATAIADLDLAMTGPLARLPRLGGRVGIAALDISIAEPAGGVARPLDATRHVRPTPTARRRIALAAARRRGAAGGTPFDAALDMTVVVPGRIRVTGRGLDAELGGSVALGGTLTEPKPVGAFHLVRGRMQILATRLDFARANLTFAGDLSPQLDFLGTTQAGGASIRVAVTGNPSDPRFTFTSSPDYPQDEILARLLFGQGAGRLTSTQALALAQAVAIYSGGTSALESLRRSLGLGDASRSSDPLTNWLGDRVSLGIRSGATPAQTGVGADISIWKQLKARGAIDARGGASVGIGAETEW
jgi:translocation and assembly module TamB